MNEQQNSEPLGQSTAISNDAGVRKISIPATNASQSPKTTPANVYVNEVKTFFTKNLLQIIRAIFLEPIKGTRSIFTGAGTDAYKHALILMSTTVLLYVIVPFIMAGSEMRSYIGFGTFFKLGLSAGLVLLIISCLAFGIKAISGKPDFKKELLTGGICGIPVMLMLLFTAIFMLFNKDNLSLLNPESLLHQGIISGIILLYFLLMLFNIVQQSFKASGTNDALSWYLSPLVICAGFYIGARIALALFMPAGYGSNPYF